MSSADEKIMRNTELARRWPQQSSSSWFRSIFLMSLQLAILVSGLFVLDTDANADSSGQRMIMLNFDDLTVGQQLTDQYRDKGVVFSGTFEPSVGTSGVVATAGVLGTAFFGDSQPNFVIVGLGSLTATFVEPGTAIPATASSVSMRVGDGEPAPEIIGVNAFDPGGQVIFSRVIHLIDEGTVIEIRGEDIAPAKVAKVRLFAIRPPEGSGFNMDDFSFVPTR